MTSENVKQPRPQYSCHVCSKWFSESGVISEKRWGHAWHFCGAECQEKWYAQQKETE